MAWSDLWDQYLAFYAATLPEGHASVLWSRLRDSSQIEECLVVEADGQVVGFAHFFPHADTWHEQPIGYLQDLFVDPQWRERGLGEALIRSVAERAAERGWSRVYWQTAADNEHARSLYDKLTGGASGFIVYELDS